MPCPQRAPHVGKVLLQPKLHGASQLAHELGEPPEPEDDLGYGDGRHVEVALVGRGARRIQQADLGAPLVDGAQAGCDVCVQADVHEEEGEVDGKLDLWDVVKVEPAAGEAVDCDVL